MLVLFFFTIFRLYVLQARSCVSLHGAQFTIVLKYLNGGNGNNKQTNNHTITSIHTNREIKLIKIFIYENVRFKILNITKFLSRIDKFHLKVSLTLLYGYKPYTAYNIALLTTPRNKI